MRKHGERLCRKLARCWRRFQHSRQTTLKLALDFSACSINQQGVISLPFEEVAARITSPLSLGSVRALLIRLENRFFLSSASRSNIAQIDHLLKRLCPVSRKSRGSAKRISRRNHTQESSEACIKNTNTKEDSYSPGMRNGDSSHSKEEKRLDRYPVRVFLCAYMILGHPDAVFSAQGEREDALSKAALKLVVEFEALVSTIVNGPGSTCLTRPSTPNFTSEAKTNSDTTTRSFAVQLAEFDAAWGSYLYQFVAWKAEDAQLLEDDLIKVACQLEFSMLQKCWSCNTAGVEASSDSQAIQQQVLEDHQLLRERVLHLTGSTGLARMQQALSQTRTHFLKERERGSLHSLSFASPQEPHMGTDMTRARTLDNEQMVNEILHEPNFPDGFSRGSTVPCKFSGIQAQIKATMEGAFWNLVMEGLAKDPPCYESIIELLKEVKMELESIAPGSWKQEIHECLDIQIFCQVLESGCQDYAYLQRLLDYAFGIISKLSAPARDSDARRSLDILLQELSQISTEKEDKIHSSFGVALVKGLRFVLEQLQILKADISAARIQALEPIIQGSAGIDYMRRLFAERFKLPEATASHLADSVRAKLPKTLAWLGGVQQTLERERNDLESLRSAYWSTLSETEACIPPISSMRTGARMVLVKPSSSTVKPSTSSPGFEHKTVPWNSMQTLVGLGLVHIICDAQAITEDTIAETLRLNLHRLRKAQNDFQHLILMSTGLLTLRQSCTPEGLNGVQLESLLGSCKTELETLLKDPGVTISQIGLLLSKFSTDGHKEESELKLATNADLLSCVLNRSLAPEDMVFIRVSVALQTSLRAIILLGQGAEGLAVVNLALQRIGVTCLQETIIDLGNLMRRVMSVTCSVHESWYACMFTAAS